MAFSECFLGYVVSSANMSSSGPSKAYALRANNCSERLGYLTRAIRSSGVGYPQSLSERSVVA